jgi:hypothetical protein
VCAKLTSSLAHVKIIHILCIIAINYAFGCPLESSSSDSV